MLTHSLPLTPFALVALLALPASAQGDPDRRPPPPPTEALEACDEKAEGDACIVELPERQLDGTCRATPHDDDLVCAPSGRRGHRAPPEEALEACDEKAEGDACVVELPERQLDGTCRATPHDEGLACAPSHRRERDARET